MSTLPPAFAPSYFPSAPVLLRLQVRPVGHKHLAVGLRSQRLRLPRRAQPASEEPDALSLHLLVEHINIAFRRFVHARRVKVVWQVNRNQVLRHDFSFNGLRASSAALRTASSSYSRRAGKKSTAERNYFYFNSATLLARERRSACSGARVRCS